MEVQDSPLDEEKAEEEQVEPVPEVKEEETEPEKSLEDEIQLMSPQDLKAFATRMLQDKREGNAEAVKAKKEATTATAELATVKADQARVKREAELAAMEEGERVKALLADSQAEAALEKELRQKAEVGNAIMSVATRLKFNDPADAVSNIEVNHVLVEGQLDHDAVEKLVADLAQNRPHYIQPPKKASAFDAPRSPRTDNAGDDSAASIVERLQPKKARSMEAAQKRFQEAQSRPGREAQLQAVIAYRKLTELDSKVGTGQYMEESLKEAGRRSREE